MILQSTRRYLLAIALLALTSIGTAADDFSIAIVGPTATKANEESALQQIINDTDDENIAFVVVNGIKSAQEVCSDALYVDRKLMFDAAKNGLIVSLAGSDWTSCKTSVGKPASIERLNRLRELFFADDFSFGATKIPLARQSAGAKFRSYAENSRWEFGPVLFATINLPGDNNYFLAAGGRNSEFEDRSVANANWLQRLASHAQSRKLSALVLFCDHDPVTPPKAGGQRDGFIEIRQQLQRLANQFSGRILIVHGGSAPTIGTPTGINWRGNLGTLAVSSGWLRLKVSANSPALFSIISNEAADNGRIANKKTAAAK